MILPPNGYIIELTSTSDTFMLSTKNYIFLPLMSLFASFLTTLFPFLQSCTATPDTAIQTQTFKTSERGKS